MQDSLITTKSSVLSVSLEADSSELYVQSYSPSVLGIPNNQSSKQINQSFIKPDEFEAQ